MASNLIFKSLNALSKKTSFFSINSLPTDTDKILILKLVSNLFDTNLESNFTIPFLVYIKKTSSPSS